MLWYEFAAVQKIPNHAYGYVAPATVLVFRSRSDDFSCVLNLSFADGSDLIFTHA
jgi:hypothetical protein